jgi:hypothetical protein
VSPARTSWSNGGRSLKVSFNIQYTGTDHGSQQGRIIVMARGPNAVMSYPEGVFGRAGGESLIETDHGEYFSVSRFREVKATFPEIRGGATGQIQEVEILILSLDGQLLFYQKLPAAQAPAKPAPKPKAPAAAAEPQTQPSGPKTAEPNAAAEPEAKKADSSELLEPGVDQ